MSAYLASSAHQAMGPKPTTDSDPFVLPRLESDAIAMLTDPNTQQPTRNIEIGSHDAALWHAIGNSSVERIRFRSPHRVSLDAASLPATLRSLDATSRISIRNLDRLATLPIEELRIALEGKRPFPLDCLKEIPTLKTLVLMSGSVTQTQALGELYNIEELSLNLPIRGRLELGALRKLRSLSVPKDTVKLSDLTCVALRNLEITSLSIAGIGAFPKLEVLDWHRSWGSGPNGAHEIARCRSLHKLTIYGVENLDVIREISLQNLEIRGDINAVIRSTEPAVFDRPGMSIRFRFNHDLVTWPGPRFSAYARSELRFPAHDNLKRHA